MVWNMSRDVYTSRNPSQGSMDREQAFIFMAKMPDQYSNGN